MVSAFSSRKSTESAAQHYRGRRPVVFAVLQTFSESDLAQYQTELSFILELAQSSLDSSTLEHNSHSRCINVSNLFSDGRISGVGSGRRIRGDCLLTKMEKEVNEVGEPSVRRPGLALFHPRHDQNDVRSTEMWPQSTTPPLLYRPNSAFSTTLTPFPYDRSF
ncbi:hypothetical protein JCM5350_007727 [Sporobolomyces pararoseus]